MEVHFHLTRKRVVMGVAAFALVVAGAAIGVTSNGYTDANGVYHGCVLKDSGLLRVLGQGQVCRSTEVTVEWNQAGLQGPQGIQGPQGPQGPQGEKGDSATGTLVERRQISWLAGNSDAYLSVSCAPGERATGGGGWTGGNGVYMMASYSESAPEPIGWRVRYENTSPFTAAINAFVVCASP